MSGQSRKGDGFGPYGNVCHGCGGRVVMTGPRALWFEWTPQTGYRSWHVTCRLKP